MAIRTFVIEALCLPGHVQAAIPVNARGAVSMHKQPRGRIMPPIVPEFLQIVECILPRKPSVDSKSCLTCSVHDLPKGSRLLSCFQLKLGSGEQQAGHFKCTFGWCRFPVDLLGMAMKASHPFTVFHALPDVMLKVLFRTLTLGPYKIACNRADLIKTWSQWACELSNDEKAVEELVLQQQGRGRRVLLHLPCCRPPGLRPEAVDVHRSCCLVGHPAEVRSEVQLGMEPGARIHASQVDDDLKTLWEPLRRLGTSLGCVGPCRLKMFMVCTLWLASC